MTFTINSAFSKRWAFLTIFYSISLNISGLAQSSAVQNQNFIRESAYQQATVLAVNYNNPNQIQHKITYLDGLGRPIQTVVPFLGVTGQDIVTAVEYDAFGRTSKNYLPYPVVGGKGDYSTTFNTATAGQAFYANTRPFSQTVYEDSPLSRVVKQAGAGSEWAFDASPTVLTDRTVKSKTFANIANEVLLFTVSNSDGTGSSWGITTPANFGGFNTAGYYGVNTLLVKEILDENNITGTGGNRSREYTDKQGRIILKRTYDEANREYDTYYIYDIYGQLRAVIPPKLAVLFKNTAQTATNRLDAFSKLAFVYCYDDQGRMIKKKVPDMGWITMTYTATDLLATQTDAKGTITYFLYDALNRLVERGITLGGVNQWLVRNYYDGTRPTTIYGLVTTISAYNNIDLTNDKGKLTGIRTRVLSYDGTLGTIPLNQQLFYDNRGRTVKTYKETYSGTGIIYETAYLQLDYVGKVLESKIEHSTGIQTIENYLYDHAGRLKSTCHTLKEINASGVVTYTEDSHLLNCIQYDAIGRLIQKNVGKLPAATLAKETTKGAAEAISYGYNIRGWLSSMVGYRKPDNNNPLTGTQNVNFILDYTTASQFNGNIGKLTWNGAFTSYSYDGLNSLKVAAGIHTENLTYDENGNINTLIRSISSVPVDNLSYGYIANTNRLLSVTDQSDKTKGYIDANATTDFTYDNNGNLIDDRDKNIVISYNYLNLVRQITGSTTQNYAYDGNGAKQAQSSGTQWKGYLGAGEYINNSLYRLGTAEGYIMPNINYVAGSTNGKYSYFYSLKDHLGNIRAVITDDKDAIQVQSNDYTAFGVAVSNDVSKNKYLYNGKELQDGTNWLDYGARMYQPELARWMTVDPLTEERYWINSYNYTSNNPINRIDLDGRLDEVFLNTKTKELSTLKTNDKFDKIVIDGKYVGNTEKGYASRALKGLYKSNEVEINFGKNANSSNVSLYTKSILVDIMNRTDNESIKINSTTRTPESQALAMSENVEKKGLKSQKALYGSAGDKVLDLYPSVSKMTDKINELGPTTVSKHCCNPSKMNVVDISPKSENLNNPRMFSREAQRNSNVSRVLSPYNSSDPAIHIEIPQK